MPYAGVVYNVVISVLRVSRGDVCSGQRQSGRHYIIGPLTLSVLDMDVSWGPISGLIFIFLVFTDGHIIEDVNKMQFEAAFQGKHDFSTLEMLLDVIF